MSNRKSFQPIEHLETRRLMSTYYVSTTGTDVVGTPGTITQPYATVKRAAARCVAGDTVLIRGGTYKPTAQESITAKGTAAAHITIKPYGSETVVFDGTKLTTGFKDIFGISGNYIDLSNITVQNSQQHGMQVWNSNYVTISNIKALYNKGIGVSISGTSFTNVLVQNSTFYRNSFKAATWHMFPAIAANVGTNIVIRGNTISETMGVGMDLVKTGAGCIVEKNTLHDNYNADIYIYNEVGATVRNNFIYSNQLTEFFFNGRRPSAAIMIGAEGTLSATNPGSKDNTIYNNVIVGSGYGLYYSGWSMNTGLVNTKFVNNTVANTFWAALNIDAGPHSNSLIANNIFYKMGGYTAANLGSTTGITLRNNIWFGKTPTAAQMGTNSVVADPKFINPTTKNPLDYRVQTGSPAYNKGYAISWLTTDYTGGARPKSGAIDIGAFEA